MFYDTSIDTPVKLSVWEERARQYGERCTVDLGIPENEFEKWTQEQTRILISHLRGLITSTEQNALDYGAGSGRFSFQLLAEIEGFVTAFEPCEGLARLIPRHPGLRVETGPPSDFFLRTPPSQFDLIWITLVLGGLPDQVLPTLAENIWRVASPDALLFFAEHTAPTHPGSDFWRFRPLPYYLNLFHGFDVSRVGSYMTRGNEVSIMAGRRR